MKKQLLPLILVFELFLLISLSGCILTNFDIAKLRYFKPKGFNVKKYTIDVKANDFMGLRGSLTKKVEATYESTKAFMNLKAGTFSNSFEMHEFWHNWAKKQFGLRKAIESEIWWFSGKISKKNMQAWYIRDTIFVISSTDDRILDEIHKEISVFTSAFSEVGS